MLGIVLYIKGCREKKEKVGTYFSKREHSLSAELSLGPSDCLEVGIREDGGPRFEVKLPPHPRSVLNRNKRYVIRLFFFFFFLYKKSS